MGTGSREDYLNLRESYYREDGENYTGRNFIIGSCVNMFIRVIKSRSVRWAGHVACMREM